MPSFNDILAPLGTVKVPFNSVEITISYDPNVITPRLSEDMKAAVAAGDSSIKQYLGTMVKWIKTWDLTDASGEVMAITSEVLLDFPDKILSGISGALMADMAPKATSL